jgi:hypothetical protein
MALAHAQKCAVVNLSERTDSRLAFPLLNHSAVSRSMSHGDLLANQNSLLVENKVSEALQFEKDLAYMVESGRYWESETDFDKDKLKAIDDIWLLAKKSAT